MLDAWRRNTNRRLVAGTKCQNANLDNNDNKSKKIKTKKVKRNPKSKDKNERLTSQGSEIFEIEFKNSTIESELDEKKNDDVTAQSMY